MSVNVRPAKKIVEEPKKNDIDVNLTEKALQMQESMEKVDTPEKFFALEDRIAMDMTSGTICDQFSDDYIFLRKAIDDYMEGKPTGTETIAKLARFRRNTRLCHYATAQMRKAVADRMEIVDAKLLQLQNVTSEVQHIQKEIDRCLDFSAGDEELDLIPVEQFYAEAPESLTKPDETTGDEHEQYLARLKFENDQRRELLSTLNELEGRRNVLQSDIHGKEVRLQKLKPKMDDLSKTAEPAFEIVGAKFKDLTIDIEQRKLSLTLPTPLAVAHVHATVYKDLHNDKFFDFRIIDNGDSIKTTKDNVELKKRRKEDETTLQKINKTTAKIFDSHPMSLEFDIDCPNDDIRIIMSMQYLTELKVVTCKWHIHTNSENCQSVFFSDDTLISNLYDGDSGDKCPTEVGDLKVEHLKLSFDSETTGKPYRFAQELCGGIFDRVAATDFFKKMIKAIRERIANRVALDSFIKSMELKKKEVLGIESDVKISSFKHCDEESFSASIPTSLSELISKSETSDRFSYKVEGTNGKSQKLTAFFSIPANYPRCTVLFGIIAPEGANIEKVRELEDRLNNEADYVDDVNSLKEQLGIFFKHIDLS